MKYQKLLCVLTATQKSEDVITHGVHLAQQHQAELHILLALENLPPNANMVMETASYIDSKVTVEQHAQEWLTEKLTSWQQDYPMSGQITVGDPLAHIEQVIAEESIDLVIKHAADDMLDRLFGTDDMHLVRRCSCPVLLTHHTLPHQYKHVMVAIDANYNYAEDENRVRKELNQRLAEIGFSIAKTEQAQCHLVSVFDVYPPMLMGDGFISIPPQAMKVEADDIRNEQASILSDIAASAPSEIVPQQLIMQGNPRSELPEIAEDLGADLVIMGTSARTGLPGLLLGNTAEAILNQLNCAVLVVRPK